MPKNQYQAQELITLVEQLKANRVSGVLHLDAEVSIDQKRSRVLVWKDGDIVYGGLSLPNNQDFAKILGQKLNQQWIDTAISFAQQKGTTQTSIRALLESFVKMRLFTWEQIETLVYTQVVLTLEQVLPYAGQFQFDDTAQFDLCHGADGRGLDWDKLMLDLTHRQDQWFALIPLIPSPEAVPHLQVNGLQTITNPTVGKHLQEWVDGQRSLVEIAEFLHKDPLSVAQSYQHWVQSGWVVMESSVPTENILLPTILAVDDSAVMQKLIKRALATYYRVLVTSNAADTLNLLHKEKISLLLLDVSLPDINGLELCSNLRSMSQFRELPIIMLTGRDGMVDKLKGQISGSTEYLTKPFDAENLRRVVGKYINLHSSVTISYGK